MSQYRDESQAIARAINCGEGRPQPADWQRIAATDRYGREERLPNDCDILGGIDRLLADSMTRALIHRSLTEIQWRAVTAVYSGDENEQVKAVDRLAVLTTSPGRPLTRRVWIGCWANAALAKKFGREAVDWDGDGTDQQTLRRQKHYLRKELNGIHKSAMEQLQSVLKSAGLIE